MLHLLLAVSLISPLALASAMYDNFTVGALYTMTNDPSGNAVVVNSITLDGTIFYSKSVPTGGNGMHAQHTPPPNGPDSLFSAGAVVVSGDNLFVANPGSNTISMFYINPSDPTNITLVGEPVSSYGEFPVSIDVSPKNGDVCVLNSGSFNGVACYKNGANGLMRVGDFVPLGIDTTTPPTGPAGSASHILFSPDGSKLHVSVKGIPGMRDGYIATWDVACNGSLSSEFVKTIPPMEDGLLPFGMVNVVGAADAIISTDPFLGLTVYNWSMTNTTYGPLTIAGQQAACWAEYSRTTDSYWISDLGAKVYEIGVDLNTMQPSLLSKFVFPPTFNATDIAIASVLGKEYLYVLSPGVTTFSVFSLIKSNTTISQVYDFGTMVKDVPLNPINIAGAAVYVM